jgi:hypothetical protein
MVRLPLPQGGDAIDLLKQDNEGDFVLEGESGQLPDKIGFLPEFGGVTVGGADQEGDGFDVATQFELGEGVGPLAGRQCLAPLVHGDPVVACATIEELRGNAGGVARFDLDQFDVAVAAQALEVIFHSQAGVIEGGFAGDHDADFHAAKKAGRRELGESRLALLRKSGYFTSMKHLPFVLSLPLVFLGSCAGFRSGDDPDSEAAQGRKVMALQEKFDRFDYNGDGLLTRAEIAQGVKEAGVTGVTDKELDQLIKAYDVNGDGAISRWETQHAIDSPLPGNKKD